MGKEWDHGVPGVPFWAEVFRVLKPGAHLLAFGGTRTYHRLACAIEDAGFEIRDQIGWAYGSGFPKSLDVSKAIDKAAGAERETVGRRAYGDGHVQNSAKSIGFGGCDPAADTRTVTAAATPEAAAWQGWGTALKPAWEPICVARKPLVGTVAANVLAHGTGALNIDGCRVGTDVLPEQKAGQARIGTFERTDMVTPERVGRWPANLAHDGSDEVLACFPETKSGSLLPHHKKSGDGLNGSGTFRIRERTGEPSEWTCNSGSAARFFYCAKASNAERGEGNTHPTVKPVALMRWLVRLVTPPGGTVLDPFAGSGTTGLAASIEQFDATLIEREPKYAAIARARIDAEAGMFGTAAE
jgi:site-specific DNA-methyltransferase (adenine-specific)